MPSEQVEGDQDYKDTLAQLQEIVNKFKNSHTIILCGDMNASLCRANGRRDKALKEFIELNEITLPPNYSTEPTFFHHNGKWVSQIDYIFNAGLNKVLFNEKIEPMHPLNTSDHTAVTGKISIKIQQHCTRPMKVFTKPNWSKCDIESYTSTIKEEQGRHKSNTGDTSARVKQLEMSMHKAAKKSIPSYRKLKALKTTGKGIWNKNISMAAKDAKTSHRLLKEKINRGEECEVEKRAHTENKRQLRRLQRQAHASKKTKFISDVMLASSSDSKTFHKLIRQQRSIKPSDTSVLYINEKQYEEEEMLSAWKIHFDALATPTYDTEIFDLEQYNLAKMQNDIISELNKDVNEKITPTSVAEVEKAIDRLNSGKAMDENGIVAEHYKNAKNEVSQEVACIINEIFEDLQVPQTLKNGILTPILKKNKDKTIPGNYRGIVVTNTFSKILESVIKERLEQQLLPTQNPLQRGFTEGVSCLCAAFIITEATSIYKYLKKPLEMVAIDAEKAFDTVNHEIMLNKLYHDGVTGDMWTLLKDLYTNMTIQVKWGDQTTEHIDVHQGIRQGAKLSTLLYKRYNNTILTSLKRSYLGAKIGDICIASPTCADDIALLGDSTDIQAMLDIIEFHTRRDLVKINPGKTEVLNLTKTAQNTETSYRLCKKEISRVENLKHLGINRKQENKVNSTDRIKVGRQTCYALLGAGFHVRQGMSPLVPLKIWKTYVTPRFLYGLEVQHFTKSDLMEFERLQRATFRRFLCLPERTASVALYILLGTEPIESTIDKNIMSLLLTIARQQESVEKKIIKWELEELENLQSSFAHKASRILQKYNLPTIEEIFQNPPSKYKWKAMVKKGIDEYWSKRWDEEKSSKSTLKYLSIQDKPTENAHNILKAVNNNQFKVRKAEVKTKIATGTYPLQALKSKFSKKPISPKCKLCNQSDEDIKHFLLICKGLEDIRKPLMSDIIFKMNDILGGGIERIKNEEMLIQAIIDCSSLAQLNTIDAGTLLELERMTQAFCYKLHSKRASILVGAPH